MGDVGTVIKVSVLVVNILETSEETDVFGIDMMRKDRPDKVTDSVHVDRGVGSDDMGIFDNDRIETEGSNKIMRGHGIKVITKTEELFLHNVTRVTNLYLTFPGNSWKTRRASCSL